VTPAAGSADANAPLPALLVPAAAGLSTKAGMHRFTWDVHYQPLPGGGGARRACRSRPIPFNTAPAPTTPWAPPGQYTVKLTVNGKTLSQPLTVKQDPRVKTPALGDAAGLHALERPRIARRPGAFAAAAQAQRLRELVAEVAPRASGDLAAALTAFDKTIEAVAGSPVRGRRAGRTAVRSRGAGRDSTDAVERASFISSTIPLSIPSIPPTHLILPFIPPLSLSFSHLFFTSSISPL
jgi:hypothetical protein